MTLTVSDMNDLATEVIRKKDEFNEALAAANLVGVSIEASLRWNHVGAPAAGESVRMAAGKPTLSELVVTCSIPLPLVV